MNRKLSLALATVSSAFVAVGAAQAQKVGTYSGTADDGSFISFSVTGTGPFTLANGDVNFSALCGDGSTASEGWGFFLGTPIAGATDFHSSNDYYDIRGTLRFPNDSTIKGNITSVTAVFDKTHNPPNGAKFCKSAKQNFVLKFQHTAVLHDLGRAVVLH